MSPKNTEHQNILLNAGLKPKTPPAQPPLPPDTTMAALPAAVVPPDFSPPSQTSVEQKRMGRPFKQEEKATEPVSVYFTQTQIDKLDDLHIAFKRRYRQNISVNEMIRQLVDGATIESFHRKQK